MLRSIILSWEFDEKDDEDILENYSAINLLFTGYYDLETQLVLDEINVLLLTSPKGSKFKVTIERIETK